MRLLLVFTFITLCFCFITAKPFNHIGNSHEDADRVIKPDAEILTDDVFAFHNNKASSANLTSVNPDSAQVLSAINTISSYTALSPDGNILLLYSYGIKGFQIYNVSNPELPTFASSYYLTTHEPVNLAAAIISSDSKTAFITYSDMGTQWLLVIDLTDLTSPTHITSRALYEDTEVIALYPDSQAVTISPDGQTIFVWACVSSAYESMSSIMATINVSNAANPQEISHYSYGGGPCTYEKPALSVANNKLLFNDGVSLLVLDISNLQYPSLINTISLNSPDGLAISSDGKNAFVIVNYADEIGTSASLLIFDIANPVSPLNISLGYHYETQSPQLIAISASNDYIFAAGGNNLVLINITDYQNLTYGTLNTISSPTSITISSDGRTAYIASEFQVTIVELYLDIQQRHVFSLPADDKIQNISLKSNGTYKNLQTMVMSSDRNIAFMMYSDSYLEIYDISNISAPNFLSMFNIMNYMNCVPVVLSPDETIAFLPCNEELVLVNITNLTSPTHLTSYSFVDSIVHFDLSIDGKVGFVTLDNKLETVNLTSITALDRITETEDFSDSNFNAVSFGLSQDTSLGFVFLQNYSSYAYTLLPVDTSNVSALTNLSLLYIGNSGSKQSADNLFVSISPNNEAVFVTLSISGGDIHIYDFSDPTSPIQVTWPEIQISTSQAVVFSQDSKIAFIATSVELLVIDISILASPMILRAYPAPNIVSIVLSQDESIAYLGTTNGTLLVITLEPEYALDLWKQEYELGGIYTGALVPLQINSGNKFNPMSQNYSFLEVSFYNIETSPGTNQTVTAHPPLPNWISFESDLKALTVSPVSAAQMGSYQVYGALSNLIPNDAFDNLISNSTEAEDLFATLISLGYISTQGFLTSNFDPNSKLFLFSQYSDLELDIRQILAQYYIEITTSISVVSSLSLSLSQSMSVNTKSPNTLNIIIQVNNSEAQFASSDYAVVTMISSDCSTLSMEGSLSNINTALAEIIINLSDNVTECDGSVTISDGLNPPINQSILNIPQYFIHNQAPVINSNFSIQAEISQTSIYTGEEFLIDLAKTFVDSNGQDLQYSLSMQDSTQQVPEWLMLKDQTLVGTPPEQVSDSEIYLIITAKNQFKSQGTPVTINIKISLLYGLKLVGTYGGALITIIGLYIYINTIYNILCTKRYRYPKYFTIEVGDERSVHNICTIGFIGKEIRATGAVFQELKRAVARDLNVKSVSKKELLAYFLDPASECLLEDKLVRLIRQVIFDLEEKNKFRQDKSLPIKGHLRNEVVQQLVINKVLIMQLNSPQENTTTKVFHAIKKDWLHLVELGTDPTQFKVNQRELKKSIKETGILKFNPDSRRDRVIDSSNENLRLNASDDNIRDINLAPLIHQNRKKARGHDNINLDLLERALIAVAFNIHNLDIDPIYTKIIINQLPEKYNLWMKIKKLFKRDLLQIEFVGRGDTGYGMKYEVRKGVLRFYGVPESELKHTTLIVYITNKRGRILRELWIKCMDEDP